MKCWHISPNGKPGKCKGEDVCAYRKQGIKLEHFDSLAQALLSSERDTAVKRLASEGIPARAEITQEQASLIPARDKALYIADFKNRVEAATLNNERLSIFKQRSLSPLFLSGAPLMCHSLTLQKLVNPHTAL